MIFSRNQLCSLFSRAPADKPDKEGEIATAEEEAAERSPEEEEYLLAASAAQPSPGRVNGLRCRAPTSTPLPIPTGSSMRSDVLKMPSAAGMPGLPQTSSAGLWSAIPGEFVSAVCA